MSRCGWAKNDLAIRYHDEEWGVPNHDDRRWFEFLTLEGAQAGLSWDTILRKRENYRRAFAGFDPAAVARFGGSEVERLLADPGIVRNRSKVASAVRNAAAFLRVREEFGGFDAYIWRFVDGRPIRNAWRSPRGDPGPHAAVRCVEQGSRGRGFNFVGSTICYALMQATGLVNDHLVDCFRWPEVGR